MARDSSPPSGRRTRLIITVVFLLVSLVLGISPASAEDDGAAARSSEELPPSVMTEPGAPVESWPGYPAGPVDDAPLPLPATTPPSLTAIGTPNPSKPIRPPESSPLSHEIIKRDCGFSVEFSDGNALWIYCDSVDVNTTTGTFHYFRHSTAAFARATDPYTVLEHTGFWLSPSTFIEPTEAYNPCPADDRHVIWPSSATVVPASGGRERVIIYYGNLCYDWDNGSLAGYTLMSTGVADWYYDPAGPKPYLTPIQAKILTPNLWGAGTTPYGNWGKSAVYGHDGYVYVYRCGATSACQVGRVRHASVHNIFAYRYFDGTGWMGLPTNNKPTMSFGGGTFRPTAMNIVYMPQWDLYAHGVTQEPGAYSDTVEVRLARSPMGPFGAPALFANTTDCSDGPRCYGGYVHSQLSDDTHVGVSLYDWHYWPPRGGQVVAYRTKVSVAGNSCATDFTDVGPDHEFCFEIAWFADQGITTGWPDGTFRPTRNVSRQAMAAWFYRSAGSPPGPFPDPGFSDVEPDDEFYEEISWFAQEGIGEGFDDGTFRPGGEVTRQAMAAWFYRSAGSPPGPFPSPGFTDVKATDPFYTEISWFSMLGITNGFEDGTYRPAGKVTRQAIAAFFYRIDGN